MKNSSYGRGGWTEIQTQNTGARGLGQSGIETLSWRGGTNTRNTKVFEMFPLGGGGVVGAAKKDLSVIGGGKKGCNLLSYKNWKVRGRIALVFDQKIKEKEKTLHFQADLDHARARRKTTPFGERGGGFFEAWQTNSDSWDFGYSRTLTRGGGEQG